MRTRDVETNGRFVTPAFEEFLFSANVLLLQIGMLFNELSSYDSSLCSTFCSLLSAEFFCARDFGFAFVRRIPKSNSELYRNEFGVLRVSIHIIQIQLCNIEESIHRVITRLERIMRTSTRLRNYGNSRGAPALQLLSKFPFGERTPFPK